MDSSNPSHKDSGNPAEEEVKGVNDPEGVEDTKKISPSNQHGQSSYELTETDAAYPRSTQVSTKSFVCIL